MTEVEIKSVFRLVLAGWPTQRQRLTNEDVAEMAMLYTAGIADLEYGAARAAVERIARTAKWMPTIADIREAALVITHGHVKTGAEAWGEVLKKIRRYGWGRSPGVDFQFDDPITARVVHALGWSELCHSEGAMIAADRARFIEAYTDIAATARADVAATPGLAVPALPAGEQRRELAAPRPVLSPEERKNILDEVMAEAAKTNPQLFGPDGIYAKSIRAEDIVNGRMPPYRCKACNWEGYPNDGKCESCPGCGLEFNRMFCESCDCNVKVDEDGCCCSCGRDAQVVHEPGVH